MLTATIGLALMCLIGIISVRAVRRRLRRETWWLIHLWMYLALAISFAHVIVLGPAFVGHPLTQVVWSVAWAATAGLVLCYRFGLPVVRSLRHRLTVTEVRQEGPGVVSVICTGRRLDRLAVSGGQFFCWRFLARGMWWQAHPYSLSALPQPPYLRLTVKAVGDHSSALASIRPGTKIAIEGPYGAFTRYAQRRPRALLVAAGIGVTALRSLLEDLPRGSAPVVLLRASRPADLVLRTEVRELVKHRRGTIHELVGSREEAAIDEVSLPRLVPDLAQRDLYVCGPEGFVASDRRYRAEPGYPGRGHPPRGIRPLTGRPARRGEHRWEAPDEACAVAGRDRGRGRVPGRAGAAKPASPRDARQCGDAARPARPATRPSPARARTGKYPRRDPGVLGHGADGRRGGPGDPA